MMSSDTTTPTPLAPAVQRYLREQARRGGLATARNGTGHKWDAEKAKAATNRRWRQWRQDRAAELARVAVSPNLTTQEQTVLTLRTSHTLTQIARQMGVSRQRVMQIEREAKGKAI